MTWLVILIFLNFFINLFIVYRNDAYSDLVGWKVKTKHGYKLNEDGASKPIWAVLLPCFLTPIVFNFFISTTKTEEKKDKKRRELAMEYQKNNPPKR